MPPSTMTNTVATAVSSSTEGFRADERRVEVRLASRYLRLT